MALIKPTAVEERTQGLNASHQLPRDNYVVRFIEEVFSPSKSTGNPMVTLTAEIVAPDVIVSPYTGEKLEIAGAKLKPQYFTLQVKDDDGNIDAKKTQNAIDRYCDFRKRCGMEVSDEGIDNSNPPLGFKGIKVDAILDCEEFVQRKTPTPEQRASGKPGDEIINPQTGKPIKSFKPMISMVLGPNLS